MNKELDPYPYVVTVTDGDEDHYSEREGERIASPTWVTFWDSSTEALYFDPRPEYSQDREDYS